ncbi:DUF6194 family protein [Streptomyces genisteinicus]|uniref:DUF6194 domain-containing protein n=1 Tax=Streptomyces genisteinicus TaxID=2768068 RepID=A0A7H0HM75_9ACTN|nr:DUF6194 family protein [Streptomyces genisteinicus]QNP61641.1 hypothetical protein IAG43_01005 [Streptomyces genisteinicus]
MTQDEIISFVAAMDGVLTLRPAPGDGSPDVAWGDTFFYYAPDGVVPAAAQPFATIVTKNLPGDATSRLDRPDAHRVNIAAGKEEFTRWTGRPPGGREPATTAPAADDTVVAHPVYAAAGWLAVVNPGPRTRTATAELLSTAHRLARARHERRPGPSGG